MEEGWGDQLIMSDTFSIYTLLVTKVMTTFTYRSKSKYLFAVVSL
jgi:hypothetical protein